MSIRLTAGTVQTRFDYDDPFTAEMISHSTPETTSALLSHLVGDGGGRALYILQLAGLTDLEVTEKTSVAGHRYSHIVKRKLNAKAYEAFRNLSDNEDFVGDINEFATALLGYATLYQETLISAGICPIGPYCARMYAPERPPRQHPNLPPEYRQPSLESILEWASDIGTFLTLYSYVCDLGFDSMLEAYKAGVPVEDIVA